MFDHVKCELPLPDGWDAVNMQTKYFGCDLDIIYTITRDGRLMRRHAPDSQAVSERSSEWDMNFHGIFQFYGTDAEKKWHEYAAKFTNGQLVTIEAVDDETNERPKA